MSCEKTLAPIEPARHASARELSRDTAKLLRAVADDRQSFAIRHFGRAVAFLVPLDGRVPKRRRGKPVYEVEVPDPLVSASPASGPSVGSESGPCSPS